MKETELVKILARVKAIWSRQSIDEIVKAEWFDCLEDFEPWDVNQAISELRDTGREDPPTPGEVKQHSFRVEERRQMNERKKVLEDRSHSAEEMKSVKQMLDEFFARHGGRPVLQPDGTFRRAATDLLDSVANHMDMNARLAKREPGAR